MLKKLLFFIAIIIAANSCTRDDLCSAAKQTTSKLVIQFKNFENPSENKGFTSLSVITDLGDVIVVNDSTTSLITIPLFVRADITSYRFIKDINDTITINVDSISFNYRRVDEYLNRACSFKTIFYDVNALVVPEDITTNWIRSIEIVNDTIENENEAHINIFH
ncbi:MAG: hypothetical protein ACI9SJ_000831 [Flavobacteriaceae bacterium]|jgi:hypothetical protein|uniref:DUF6452 family protein n=1 Tax=Candidatus Marifrigoribacter sp. Uisw_064 TaxID=3230970 RepID=UPI003AE0A31F